MMKVETLERQIVALILGFS